MAGVKIEKAIASLPVALEANAIYLVRAGAGFDLYVVDSTGTTAHQLNGSDAPGGASGQIQFNDGGELAGAAQVKVDANGNLVFLGQTSKPAAPTEGLQVSTRVRAGGLWMDVQDPVGKHFTLQEHIGLHRIKTWSPSSGTVVVASGMPRTGVGTASHPALSSTGPHPKNSAYRWRMTSAATAPSACDERSASVIWRGNAAGLGGFKYVNCFALNTLQPASVAFFGISASAAAFSTSLTLASLTNCIGIGFTNGTHTNWQVVMNDGTGAPTLIDMGANFPINTNDLLTFTLYSDPNGAFIGVRVVNEATGAVYDQAFTTDIPANTTFFSPRNYLNNGGAAAAVIYDCCSVYIGADY